MPVLVIQVGVKTVNNREAILQDQNDTVVVPILNIHTVSSFAYVPVSLNERYAQRYQAKGVKMYINHTEQGDTACLGQ